MLLLRMLLLRTVQLQLRVRQPLPAADEIRHDLRGRDGGGTFVVSVQLPRMPRLVPRRAPAQARLRLRSRRAAATRRPEPRRELRPARPAHYHRTSAARARVRLAVSLVEPSPAFLRRFKRSLIHLRI